MNLYYETRNVYENNAETIMKTSKKMIENE